MRADPIVRATSAGRSIGCLVEYEGDIHRVSRGKFRSDITVANGTRTPAWFQLRALGR